MTTLRVVLRNTKMIAVDKHHLRVLRAHGVEGVGEPHPTRRASADLATPARVIINKPSPRGGRSILAAREPPTMFFQMRALREVITRPGQQPSRQWRSARARTPLRGTRSRHRYATQLPPPLVFVQPACRVCAASGGRGSAKCCSAWLVTTNEDQEFAGAD